MACWFALFDIIDIFIPPRFATCLGISNLTIWLSVRLYLCCCCSLVWGEKFADFQVSWASLVAVLFVLLVPLGVSSGFRIYQQNNQQLSSQLNQQTTQMKQLRNLLSKATTSEELSSILARPNVRRLG